MITTLDLALPHAEFIQKMNDIVEKVDEHHRSGIFLARAFCNWYRKGRCNPVDLGQLTYMDEEYVLLFFSMTQARRDPAWNDNELWQLEQYCMSQLEKNGYKLESPKD